MAGGAGSQTACRQWGCVAEHQGQAKLAHSTVPKALVSQAGRQAAGRGSQVPSATQGWQAWQVVLSFKRCFLSLCNLQSVGETSWCGASAETRSRGGVCWVVVEITLSWELM